MTEIPHIFNEISSLATEQKNPKSKEIDSLDTLSILKIINDEDAKVAKAVGKCLPQIAIAVDNITESFKKGGRLFYFGAGTSGRLGVLDAAECPPTFGTDPQMVQGIIAGGNEALIKAVEGAEDNPNDARKIATELGINKNDVICGLAASGRTPFVRGALEFAKENDVYSILVSAAPIEAVKSIGIDADCYICLQPGPEILSGSTRMKSGTAQKMTLNMLTTASMIKLGKTFGNVMVDLQSTNIKLKERSKKIVMDICNLDYSESEALLAKCNGSVKTAIVCGIADIEPDLASQLIAESNGFVRLAIKKGLELSK